MRALLPLCLSVLLLAALGASLLTDGAVAAVKWKVPGDFDTIQEAVDAASDGDTILVSGGPYHENVAITWIDDLTLTGKNVVIDPPDDQIALYAGGCNRLTISGFRLEASGAEGLVFEQVQDALVSKCVVVDPLGDGILLSGCSAVTVTRCVVRTAGRDGIGTEDSDRISVVKNVIDNTTEDGIALSFQGSGDQTSDSIVSGNTILGTGQVGIGADGNDNVIEKNTVSDTGATGISVGASGSSDGVLITKNRVTGGDDAGIRVNSHASNVRVLKNTVSGIGEGAGISRNGFGTCEITGNKVGDVDGAGISVSGSADLVSKNKVAGTGNAGIHLDASTARILGNKVSGAGTDGFLIDGQGNLIEKNSAKDSGGFDLRDRAGANTYGKNKFGTEQIGPP